MSFWQSSGGAAAISSLGSAFSGLAGGLFARGAQKRQYKYNLKLQQQQQDWQRQMWELENMYNLPKNEVQRLLDAGINPALAFSNSGGAAAPVPLSGSAGGVSAPTADMPNVGAAAVQAALGVESTKADIDLKESLANKADNEGNAAAEQAGLTRSYKNFNEFMFGIAEENREVLVNQPRVNLAMSEFERVLLGNRLIRDTIYTGYYPTELQQGLELNRWNIKAARKKLNYIDANVALLQSQKQLTDDQARSIRLQAMCIEADAIIGSVRADAVRDLKRNGVKGANGLLSTFFDSIRSQVSDDLQTGVLRSRDNKLNMGLDLGFTKQYGKQVRDLNFNLYNQQHTLNRSLLWERGAGIVFNAIGLGLRSGSAGFNPRVSSSIEDSWKYNQRKFMPEFYF